MSLFEKSLILGSIALTGGICTYTILKPAKQQITKEDIQKKRERVLQAEDMRILYSTMTFFYLQGFQQESMKSFFLLHDILQISQPKVVALQLSEKEYEQSYKNVVANPRFPDCMKRLEIALKSKDEDKLKELEKEIEIKNLEKLYMFDYCKKNKCQVLFGDKSKRELDQIFDQKMKVQELQQVKQNDISENLSNLYETTKQEFKTEPLPVKTREELEKEVYTEYREDFYINTLMEQLQPKYTFLPSSPYKTIVGIVEPEFVNSMAKKWKTNFKSVYGHEIIEDESIEEKYKEFK